MRILVLYFMLLSVIINKMFIILYNNRAKGSDVTVPLQLATSSQNNLFNV